MGLFRLDTQLLSPRSMHAYGLGRIPTAGIGPGDEALAHQPNEYVRVTDIEKAVQAYDAIVESSVS